MATRYDGEPMTELSEDMREHLDAGASVLGCAMREHCRLVNDGKRIEALEAERDLLRAEVERLKGNGPQECETCDHFMGGICTADSLANSCVGETKP